jgi:hypothetical protein
LGRCGDGIDVVCERERDHVGIDAIDDGTRLLAGPTVGHVISTFSPVVRSNAS